jgi:uncharacterized protein
VIVVPDAGPLIYLAGSGHLELLRELYSEVVVPRTVYEEVTIAGEGLIGADEVRAVTWLTIEDGSPDPTLLEVLDRGEAAAIPLAQRLRADLLIDDLEARRIARGRGLRVVGTLGVLLAAKRKELLPEVTPVLVRMETLGMFVSGALREEILRLAGE